MKRRATAKQKNGADPKAASASVPADERLRMDIAKEVLAQRWRNWHVRTVWSLAMISAFGGILLMGHFWVVVLVTVIHTLVYREVISIAWVPSKAKRMPWFRTMAWYFLLSTNYYLYGQTVIDYFKDNILSSSPLATHHTFVSFSLYLVGFVLFVFNLQKDHYRFQFSQFAWTHMCLLLVVVQSQFIIKNIFEGLVWFLLPVSLVICNDISAYVFGFFFGKTPLIQLSPKKTWEGFIGAFGTTIIFGFFFAGLITQSNYFVCPVIDLHTNYWSTATCTVASVFEFRDVLLPSGVTHFLKVATGGLLTINSVRFSAFQIHAVIMALFASAIAPFGGFFASGIKRAFQIKDFSDYIPGHGGLTDRMDCQFLMSLFAYLYHQSFISTGPVIEVSVAQVMETVTSKLDLEQQVYIYKMMGEHLSAIGAL